MGTVLIRTLPTILHLPSPERGSQPIFTQVCKREQLFGSADSKMRLRVARPARKTPGSGLGLASFLGLAIPKLRSPRRRGFTSTPAGQVLNSQRGSDVCDVSRCCDFVPGIEVAARTSLLAGDARIAAPVRCWVCRSIRIIPPLSRPMPATNTGARQLI
jgi:hypothetical protein